MYYHHGVKVIEINEGTRPLRAISTAIIGIVATSPDADATLFPLNRPALITNVETAIAKAGTSGTLADALRGIADQTRAIVVVVRVAVGAGEDAEAIEAATTSNVIGASAAGAYSGLQALLVAEAQLGVKPRILGAPGLDSKAVTTAMVTVAKKLRAMVYASCADAASVSEVIDYRDEFGARELMLIWPDFVTWNTATNAQGPASAVARALGLRARIDQEHGWHKTLSNIAVNGVTGISKDVHFDLQSSDNDAGLINEAGVTTLVNMRGYRFWGSRTCSDDELFAFESATRTAHVLADTIANGVASFVDKPMHPSVIRDIVETINGFFRGLVSQGYVLGASAWYNEEVNTVDNLKQGIVRIDYDYTPLPPLENLQLAQRITDTYFADFATRVNG